MDLKVLLFFHTKDLTPDVLGGLSALITKVFSSDPGISFEKVFVEDNPKISQYYNINTTPFTIIGDKRFPGIATAEQILKMKGQMLESNLSSHQRPGTITLVKGTDHSKLLSIIRDLKIDGMHILYITKTYPEALARKYGLDKDHMIWLLPRAVNDASVSMTDITKLGQMMNDFLDKHEGGIVVVEGLEALVSYNPLDSVLGLIRDLKVKVEQKKASAYFLFLQNAIDETASIEIKNLFSE